jgi:hypothetical protein
MPRSSINGVVLAVLLLSTAWCIPHQGVSCADLNSSSIGAITHNTNNGSTSHSSNNSNNSSTVLLLHHCSRLQSGHHNRPPTAVFRASTMETWDISPVSASCQSKAIHHELWQLWSTSRGAHRGFLHHGLVMPTTPPWMRSPQEKKC